MIAASMNENLPVQPSGADGAFTLHSFNDAVVLLTCLHRSLPGLLWSLQNVPP